MFSLSLKLVLVCNPGSPSYRLHLHFSIFTIYSHFYDAVKFKGKLEVCVSAHMHRNPPPAQTLLMDVALRSVQHGWIWGAGGLESGL